MKINVCRHQHCGISINEKATLQLEEKFQLQIRQNPHKKGKIDFKKYFKSMSKSSTISHDLFHIGRKDWQKQNEYETVLLVWIFKLNFLKPLYSEILKCIKHRSLKLLKKWMCQVLWSFLMYPSKGEKLLISISISVHKPLFVWLALTDTSFHTLWGFSAGNRAQRKAHFVSVFRQVFVAQLGILTRRNWIFIPGFVP